MVLAEANFYDFAIAATGALTAVVVASLPFIINRQRKTATMVGTIVEHVEQINNAVNHVDDDEPKLVDQVRTIGSTVAQIDQRTTRVEAEQAMHGEQLIAVGNQVRNHIKDHKTAALLDQAAVAGTLERRHP